MSLSFWFKFCSGHCYLKVFEWQVGWKISVCLRALDRASLNGLVAIEKAALHYLFFIFISCLSFPIEKLKAGPKYHEDKQGKVGEGKRFVLSFCSALSCGREKRRVPVMCQFFFFSPFYV